MGRYHISYACVNAKGVSATPKSRTVIVDGTQEDDEWVAKAQMQFTGYTLRTFGKDEKAKFVNGHKIQRPDSSDTGTSPS